MRCRFSYLIILLISLVYLGFYMRDGKWFFFDDFAAFRYIDSHGYGEIIKNSFVMRDVDYHKFLGYLILKFLYTNFGVDYRPYLLTNFLIHSFNVIVVYEILRTVTKSNLGGLILAVMFGVRMWLWWPSNLHDMLAGSWYLAALLIWINYWKKNFKSGLKWVCMFYLLGLATKATTVFLPISFFFIAFLWMPVRDWKFVLRKLFPLMIVMILYIVFFGRYFLTEGREAHTGYVTDYSWGTFINSQGVFIGSLGLLPKTAFVAIGVFVLLLIFGGQGNVLLTLAYVVGVLPMSFFVAHASAYYIYIPLIYLVLALGRLKKNHLWFALIIVLFNPLVDVGRIITKYRHPEWRGFDEGNVKKLVELTHQTVNSRKSEFYFSSWEMSPNLYSLVYHDALGIFAGKGRYDDYKYGYDRVEQKLVIEARD